MRRTLRSITALAAVAVLFGSTAVLAHDRHDDERGNWFTAWSISIGHRMGPAFTGANLAPDVSNGTLRMVVRPSISGTAVRVRIENTQAQTAVTFSGAFVGTLGSGAALVPGTNRRLTFGGSPGLTLAAGESAWSRIARTSVHRLYSSAGMTPVAGSRVLQRPSVMESPSATIVPEAVADFTSRAAT